MKVTRRPGEPIDKLIQRYKRQRNAEKISESLRRHECYVKPGERRRQKHKAALKRIQRNKRRYGRSEAR